MGRWFWRISFILLLLAPAGAADAREFIVVSDSAAIGYARGAVIADKANLKVPAGQLLLLIDDGGKGVRIEGPFDGSVPVPAVEPAGAPSLINAMKNIISQADRRELGAARDAGNATPEAPDAHLITLDGDGTQCVSPDHPAQFWRPPPPRRSALLLTRVTTNERAETDWPSGTATLPWPAAVGLADGESYIAAVQGAMMKARIVIRIVAFGAPSLEAAQRLSDAGCTRQALALLEGMAAPPAGR